jgi:hypothetical protein
MNSPAAYALKGKKHKTILGMNLTKQEQEDKSK